MKNTRKSIEREHQDLENFLAPALTAPRKSFDAQVTISAGVLRIFDHKTGAMVMTITGVWWDTQESCFKVGQPVAAKETPAEPFEEFTAADVPQSAKEPVAVHKRKKSPR